MAKKAPKTKSKTTRKKPASKSTARSSARKTAAKKTTARKTAGRKSKTTSAASKSSKKTARAKTPAKKSSTKKTASRGMTKKKTASTKKTATTKKKKSAAAVSEKKSKTTSKKVAPAASEKPKNKTASKSRAAQPHAKGVSRKRPKSVAEAASSHKADDQGYVFINGRRVRMISTQGITPAKRPKPAAEDTPPAEETGPEKPLKTPLSRKELNHYRNLLLIKRAELVGDLDAMEAAALRSSGGNLSHMPIHMADIGTDTYDQDFTLGLAETERKQLREIDEALQRIEDKTYGVCHMTGKDIPKARLDAKPWAKYTIEAARLVEAQSGR